MNKRVSYCCCRRYKSKGEKKKKCAKKLHLKLPTDLFQQDLLMYTIMHGCMHTHMQACILTKRADPAPIPRRRDSDGYGAVKTFEWPTHSVLKIGAHWLSCSHNKQPIGLPLLSKNQNPGSLPATASVKHRIPSSVCFSLK